MARVCLHRLNISNLRILTECRLDLNSDLVIFTGHNGSGKTSVLEAVHLLSTGRSFRTRLAADLVQWHRERVVVQGEIGNALSEIVRLGFEKRRDGAYRARIDGARATKLGLLARQLPLIVITADSQRLLTDGSEGRRRLVDWLLFHVEQRYGEAHGRYRHSLRQRNGMLRTRARLCGVAEAWNEELVSSAQQLAEIRSRYADKIESGLSRMLVELSSVPVKVSYTSGWSVDRETFRQMLERNWQRDVSRGFTNEGPHRADLEFRVGGRLARDVLSRGESKLLTVAIQLAMARLLAEFTGVLPVVMVDEIASELDESNRQRFFDALRQTGSQTLVTAVDTELVHSSGWESARRIQLHGGEATPVL